MKIKKFRKKIFEELMGIKSNRFWTGREGFDLFCKWIYFIAESDTIGKKDYDRWREELVAVGKQIESSLLFFSDVENSFSKFSVEDKNRLRGFLR